MKTFPVAVTQFKRPDGRQERTSTDLPDGYQAAYDDMSDHGCRFEAEVLTNGMVSVTISDSDEDIDISLTPNGPQCRREWSKCWSAGFGPHANHSQTAKLPQEMYYSHRNPVWRIVLITALCCAARLVVRHFLKF